MSHKQYLPGEHTFAICAYKESPYLEECIQSVLKQQTKTNMIMITSTPCEYIRKTAAEYGITLYVNEGPSGIAEDWNYALKMAGTPLVTVTHQDDIYCETYATEILYAVNHAKHPLIAFTDYGELRDGEWVLHNRLLSIKEYMMIPLRPHFLQHNRWLRRRILSFGSPICCPSVTYCVDRIGADVFTRQYRSDVDWQAWEKISRHEGSFCYIHKPLMYHRIHEESETTAIIADHDRTREDFDMFCKFWPTPIARLLEHFYGKSEKSNELD